MALRWSIQLFLNWTRFWMLVKIDEIRVRIVNWVLLVAWLLLIVSMLFPYGPWYSFEIHLCAFLPGCENHPDHLGNLIFWGAGIPQIILLIVLSGHTLWRRICPLAFVSQVTRHLKWQRQRRGPNGRYRVPQIHPESFLGRHHVRFQTSLLVLGLSLRLLSANSDPHVLALLLLTTLLLSVLVGWLWGGKAWCQYFCPMGPVEAILVGATTPHSIPVGDDQKALPQSICRTVTKADRVSSACVNCQSPCIDIDAERSYWYNQVIHKGFTLAWWAYPGLVLSFFLILQSLDPLDALYVSRGHWATDSDLDSQILSPVHLIPHLLDLPRMIVIPLALLLGACVTVAFFFFLYRYAGLSKHRCRLLATFGALNIFFSYADPLIGSAGSMTTLAVRLLVLVFSIRMLMRGWNRDRGQYLYEKVLLSFHRHALHHPDFLPTISLSPTWSRRRQMASLKAIVHHFGQQASQEVRGRLYRLVLHEISKEPQLDPAEAFQMTEPLREALRVELNH